MRYLEPYIWKTTFNYLHSPAHIVEYHPETGWRTAVAACLLYYIYYLPSGRFEDFWNAKKRASENIIFLIPPELAEYAFLSYLKIA